MYQETLRESLPRVRGRIERARERARRSDAVRVLPVTKGHPTAAVVAVRRAGFECCGENRVGELETKVGEVGREALCWHMVGHVQRNKVRRLLPLCDLIESLDSLRLARKLSREAERADREQVRALVQVNTSGEESKGGFPGDEVVEVVAEMAELPRLALRGLMTMAPLTDDESVLRRTFARARRRFEQCGREVDGFEPRHLSMGMSNDFEIAIEEGSTMVRLGTALFGERPT